MYIFVDSTNTAAITVPVVLTLVIVGLVGGWMYYAFTHPNTASGQWLIEVCVNLFNINVRENRRSNQEWTIQRHWQRWVQDTEQKTYKTITQQRKLN